MTKALTILIIICSYFYPATACAHFMWLKVDGRYSQNATAQCFLSETPTNWSEEFLKYIEGTIVRHHPDSETSDDLMAEASNGVLSADISPNSEGLLTASKVFGVLKRGDNVFLLNYYAKTGPSLKSWNWQLIKTEKALQLDILPVLSGSTLTMKVVFNSEPVSNAEISLIDNGKVLSEPLVTNPDGVATYDLHNTAMDAIRVKWVESVGGTPNGTEYSETRHFTTVTFPRIAYKRLVTEQPFPELPEVVTSFGAAVHKKSLYYYGGHLGGAHTYAQDYQVNTLWHLERGKDLKWTPIIKGPKLQGLAMVVHRDSLYRLGGFTAKNTAKEEPDLWSQDGCAVYSIGDTKWSELPNLPEPRSSLDACVLDNTIYVAGGWAMRGEQEQVWHKTAWSLDLTQESPEWRKICDPTFTKRAISIAAHKGKIFVIGGMQQDGVATANTEIYDPKTDSWSVGPRLNGPSMTGFGTSAFSIGGRLVVSTYGGTVQQLSSDGTEWQVIGNLSNERFFHRMLPLNNRKLALLGGASMEVGKFSEIDVLRLKDTK